MNRRPTVRNQQAGMSLLAVMVIVSLVGIIVAGVSQLAGNRMRAAQAGSLHADQSIVTDYINQHLNCELTATSAVRASCAANTQQYLAMISNSGTTLVARNSSKPADGTPIGDWQVRASCAKGKPQLLVEARRGHTNAAGVFSGTNPLTGKTDDWSDLFPKKALCANQLMRVADFTSSAALNSAKYLEYYADGLFKANGGDISVKIQKKGGGALCSHALKINKTLVPNTYTFKLAQGQTFQFAISVQPPAEYPYLCEEFGGTQDTLGPAIIMSRQGANVWGIHVEDDFGNFNDVSYTDSIWTISAVPI